MSGILVVAEHTRGALSLLSRELLGAALAAKARMGGPVRVLVVAEDAQPLAAAMDLPGVDEILTARSDNPHFDAAIHEEAAFAAAMACQPALVLAGHSADGLAFAPALAMRLGSGFAADVFALDVVGGALRATRSAYGNKVNVDVDFPGKAVVVLTVRGGSFPPPQGSGSARRIALDFDPSAVAGRCRHEAFVEPVASDVDIAKAEFILSIGRGIQDEKNVARFAALAERIGATLGCSRPVADSGWLAKAHQVGLTGKVASSCKLYIALGISGAVQHLHGMKHVETIIAVNTDANAPIYNVATYGCAMDVFEFADALERVA